MINEVNFWPGSSKILDKIKTHIINNYIVSFNTISFNTIYITEEQRKKKVFKKVQGRHLTRRSNVADTGQVDIHLHQLEIIMNETIIIKIMQVTMYHPDQGTLAV